jgi:NAD(P)H-dependent flavin oxidoreductase YrpB (nitropropane dioxygenase family)
MLATRFTQLVGCSIPIQQAGLGTLANPRLAAAVTNAGGLGMVSLSGATPDQIAVSLDAAREKGSGAIGANFVLPLVDPATVHECVATAAARARVVDFFYADPDPALIEIVHAAGALASWQIGSREEALAAVKAGCDFIIAQGIEAGGHVRGTISLMALLNEVLEAVTVPVLAAGGIGTGRNMAAALAAGADGVRVGTRFIAAEESGAHPQYVQALIGAEAKDTVYTDVFSVFWPDAPHRVLRSSVEAVQAFQGEFVGEVLDQQTGEREPIPRFASVTPRKVITGTIEAMPHWAGESVDGVKKMQPAAEIVQDLASDAEKLLRRWN